MSAARKRESGYNGWSNYETWAVALWLDNDEASQEFCRELARNAFDNAKPSRVFSVREVAQGKLAAALKEHIEESAPDLGASMFAVELYGQGDLDGAYINALTSLYHSVGHRHRDFKRASKQQYRGYKIVQCLIGVVVYDGNRALFCAKTVAEARATIKLGPGEVARVLVEPSRDFRGRVIQAGVRT